MVVHPHPGSPSLGSGRTGLHVRSQGEVWDVLQPAWKAENPAMAMAAAGYLALPSMTTSAAASASPKLSSGAAPDGLWPGVGKVCERRPSGRTTAAIGGLVRMRSIGREDGHRPHSLVRAGD